MNDRVSITMLEDGIADVRLIRADKMNALDPAMFEAIAAAIETLEHSKGLRAVILSGEGRAFCAGLDLASMASGGASAGKDLMDRTHGDANIFQQVAWGWRTLPVPVIAAAHGVAFGGGFQIFSGADIRFIHPETRCSIMEMKWGLVPDMAGFPLWRGNVRDDVIRELTYTNREFSGAEAHILGFATHVADDPYAKALELAQAIAGKNPHAIRGAKRIANALGHTSDGELLLAESREQKAVIRSANQLEAVAAGMQKRKPNFTD
jgi:enoyl-CoA hydratase/carnithine racemase